MTDSNRWPRRRRLAVSIGLVCVFSTLCGLPYVAWLDHPSLYHDDFMRVGSLRNVPIGRALFRPFNEHMAPLFELTSYAAWRAAGREIRLVPVTFLIASFAAFGATVSALGAVVRRETGSSSTALAAIALFTLSSVSAETVLWYSACSFQWAAAATLASWLAAASAAGSPSSRGRRAWLVASTLASMLAPAFAAIGILAAPAAMLRLLVADRAGASRLRHALRAAVPASGLAAYLAICAAFRYREVLADSLSRNLDLGAALWDTLLAPTLVLLPSLMGMGNQAWTIPGPVAAGSTLALLVAALVLAYRGRQRPLMQGGALLIVGGYLLAYAARAHAGDLWIFEISRYHLFPQIGLDCLVVAAVAPIFRRLERRRAGGLVAATLLAGLLALLQYRGMGLAGGGAFRFPDQPQLLAAAAKLEGVAERHEIGFDQLMRVLEPTQPRWAPHPWPFHPVLFLFAHDRPEGRLTDAEARAAILEGLTPDEREVLFGTMEATRHRQPAPSVEVGGMSAARLVATWRVSRSDEGQFEARGGASYLEYQVDPEADRARWLGLPGLVAGHPVEVWWAGAEGPWSADRCVRWKPDPVAIAGPVGWVIPIDALPHWRKGEVRRLRIVARTPMRLAVEPPRFLR